jgi:DASS family divalent anion:Na+ symporter
MTMSFSSETAEALRKEPEFARCPRQMLARFLPHVSEKTLAAGETLHEKGARAGDTFLIVEGAFDIETSDTVTKTVDSGLLGEESAIGMDTYVATATAKGPAKVLVLPREALWELATHRPLRERLMASFNARLTGLPPSPPKDDRAERRDVSWGQVVGWFLAFTVPALLLWLLWDSKTLPNQQALFLLAIISIIVVMWVFQLCTDFVPGLFAVLGIILLGLAPPTVALAGFASDSFFMALSILGLAAVIRVSGLSLRMLLWLLRIGPAHKAWYSFSLFITGAAITPIVPTANGRVAILAPFMNDLISAFDKTSARQEAPRLSATVLGGVSLLSAIFLSSKSVNFLIFGLLPFQDQSRFQWLYWLYAASVCGLVLVALYFLGVWLLFRNDSQPKISKVLVNEQLKTLGPMIPAEWAGLLGLGVLLLSFLTAAMHHIDVPWVALAIMFTLLMFGYLGKQQFRQQIDWSFLIFLGTLIGLVKAMDYVGLDQWFLIQLKWLRVYMAENFEQFIVILSAAIFLVRFALPINATVVVFATLLIPTAINIGLNPWLVGFIILLMSESFIWPYQASYYLQFKGIVGDDAGADDRRVLTLNALVFAMKIAAIYASIPFWKYLGLL